MQPGLTALVIPIPPILAFFLIVLFSHRSNRLSHSIAIGALVISWALSMLLFVGAVTTQGGLGHNPISASFPWLPTGETTLRMGVFVDPLSAVTLFFVAWTLLAIFIYSVGYHNFGAELDDGDVKGLPPKAGGVEPLYARFFAFVSLFAFGMLTLVLADNLLLLFIGWEIMGLCSYLLIGFWFARESARKAMVKAFITTRVGDVFMLLGLAYLYSVTGSLNYQDILLNDLVMEKLTTTPAVFGGFSTAGLIGLLLFIGTVGKSAQWPLHVWLPDAMEGPTPVSALIHAATMVSAGVYLIARFFPLITAGWYEGGPPTPTMIIIASVGAFTAVFAATIAVAQDDIKRVLAYSTISQLGYMVAAIGIGAFVAAVFHLVTHAFFKALLFLGSGSVIHGMEHGVRHTQEHIDAQNMWNMGGLRRKMPITFWTFVIGGLALSGFPFITAGFWSKDEILGHAFYTEQFPVFIMLVLAAFLTGFYTMRQITLSFLGEARTEEANHARESVWTMTAPLILLAIFALSAGWVGIGEEFPLLGGIIPNWLHGFIGGTLPEEPTPTPFHPVPLVASIVAGVGGLLVGWLVYREKAAGARDPLEKPLGPVYTLLKHKYYFDELYDRIFVRPAYWFAETFTYLWLDRGAIDGLLHAIGRFALRVGAFLRRYIDLPIVNGSGDLVGSTVKRAGSEFRFIQTGRVQQYLIVGLLFTGALMAYLLLFSP